MSADMQLTAIGLGLLYVMTKHQMLGWIAILSTFTIGAFLTFYVAYTNNVHAVLPVYIR